MAISPPELPPLKAPANLSVPPSRLMLPVELKAPERVVVLELTLKRAPAPEMAPA